MKYCWHCKQTKEATSEFFRPYLAKDGTPLLHHQCLRCVLDKEILRRNKNRKPRKDKPIKIANSLYIRCKHIDKQDKKFYLLQNIRSRFRLWCLYGGKFK